MTTDARATPRAPLAERALAERVRQVPPSGIRRFFDILATMDDVISLGVGSPTSTRPSGSWPPVSAPFTRAGRTTRQLRDDRAAPGAGRPSRAALRRCLRPRHGAAHHGRRVRGVDLALRATCDPGDEVILHEPSYVAYVPAILFAGGTTVHVATRLEDDFALDPAVVEAAITPRTKALFLGYPCNPTGAVLPDAVQDELAAIAERHDLLVYSDEIYDRLPRGVPSPVVRALPGMRERTILMGGFSKAYAMTGWRVG